MIQTKTEKAINYTQKNKLAKISKISNIDRAKYIRQYHHVTGHKRHMGLSPQKVQRIKDCSNYRLYNQYGDIAQLRATNSCMDRLCLYCSTQKNNKYEDKLLDRIMTVAGNYKNIYHIVIPIKHNHKDLSQDVFDRIRKEVRDKITKKKKDYKRYLKGNPKGYYSLFGELFSKGGFRTLEVTHNNNGYNRHINYVVLTNAEIDIKDTGTTNQYGNKVYTNKKLKKELQAMTGDSYMLSIQKIDTQSKKTIREGITDTIKYMIKSDEASNKPKIKTEIAKTIYKKRLRGMFGCLYGIKTKKEAKKSIDQTVEDIGYSIIQAIECKKEVCSIRNYTKSDYNTYVSQKPRVRQDYIALSLFVSLKNNTHETMKQEHIKIQKKSWIENKIIMYRPQVVRVTKKESSY